jgi:F0F1-type ATP synthase epsilon subunit
MTDSLFKLKVASREGTVFEGAVSAISSYNEKGKFDILGSHANFISLIKQGLLIRESGDINSNNFKDVPVKEIKFDSALMRVKENNVEVYIGV